MPTKSTYDTKWSGNRSGYQRLWEIRKKQKQDQTLRTELERDLSALRLSTKPITEDFFFDMACRNIKSTGRLYTVDAYETFRDLITESGMSLAQVGNAVRRVFKLCTGRDAPDDVKISRTVVRTAVCSLTLADRDRDKVTKSAQLHQILFDESAHMLSVNSCHWNNIIDDPEQTSLAMVRINKQTGASLAKRVRGTSEHIPSTNILSALSDNCNGMDGKYNGAMLCFWRLLRQEDDCIRLVSVASRQVECMPQAEVSKILGMVWRRGGSSFIKSRTQYFSAT